ncbi:MAG: 3-phosphoshikimate 1-carboxyvinyltransferase [Candidatus Gastranaerophilales bacterium]|nr:3-phosphoshikimate 1-carboxyvinyltransferase [Candidatus Gastranaerophilales bacterium]
MVLKGEIIIPPDKSISHRALIFSALTKSRVKIKNLSKGADCISTLKIFEKLGVKYEFLSERDLISDSSFWLNSNGNYTFDCGNSGTTTRLLTGLFSGLKINCTLVGDESLSKRPMKRIIEPLSLMGAKITSNDNKLPLSIEGADLNPIIYHSPISSAQVKSALLLAGLNTKGKTRVYEKTLSRNHSEIMLKYLGANIITGRDEQGFYTEIEKSNLISKDIEIPGDISSAAFFMVAGAIIPNSEILIKNVGINPTRSGIIDIFKQSEIDFELINERNIANELIADIKVKYTPEIKPFKIEGDIIPRLIDEIPILALLATQAQGESIVKDATDLRNKESDRIKTICDTFKLFEVDIEENTNGFIIEGKKDFNKDVTLQTYLDHRLAMTYYILSLINKGNTEIKGFECTNTSFPEFLDLINKLTVSDI